MSAGINSRAKGAIATLANGQKVKAGDGVAFTNSDGERCKDVIRQRPDGSLYFWNADFPIGAYRSAECCEEVTV